MGDISIKGKSPILNTFKGPIKTGEKKKSIVPDTFEGPIKTGE